MVTCQIELPSAAAAVRSVGVEIKKSRDLGGEEVNSRRFAFGTGDIAVPTGTVDDWGASNGKGNVWVT